jgi:TolA-binding protein
MHTTRTLLFCILVLACSISLTSCRSSRSSRTNTQRGRTQQQQTPQAQAAQGPSAKSVMDHADSALQRVSQLGNESTETMPMMDRPMMPNFAPPRRPWGEPFVPQPNVTEYGLYEAALGAYNGRRYDESIALLSQVVMTGRPPELVPNAYYWMGESFYASGRYAEAMPYFDYVTRIGPQYKREISLFKLSRGNIHLGNRQAANMYYERLRNEYPRSRYISTLRKLGAR